MFDIVIPFHPKDTFTIDLCLSQIRKHICGWQTIYVIGERPIHISFGDTLKSIDEPSKDSIIDFYVQRNPPMIDRAGWLHQTLIKLQAKKYIPDLLPQYVVIDADVLFMRPVPFFEDSEQWFAFHKWSLHGPYKDMFERLTGIPYPGNYGFVMHHMMYRQDRLDEMIAHVLDYTKSTSLEEAVLDNINVMEPSPFAECDTFGAWMKTQHLQETRPRQLHVEEKAFIPGPAWMNVYEGTDIDLVACHDYMRAEEERSS